MANSTFIAWAVRQVAFCNALTASVRALLAQMASNSSGSSSYCYHSADVGPAHVINLCPYVDYTPSSNQWQWLDEDMAGVNPSITPWVIVDIHNPW